MKIETWSRLPAAVRDHLVERMRDRNISLEDLNRLRLWMESNPDAQTARGTRNLVPSNFAVEADIRRRSCFQARQRGDRSWTNAVTDGTFSDFPG